MNSTEKIFGKTYIVKVLEDGECITEGELIRCKDCKYSVRRGRDCTIHWWGTKEDDYCSRAERKEE